MTCTARHKIYLPCQCVLALSGCSLLILSTKGSHQTLSVCSWHCILLLPCTGVPVGLPSHGGDVGACVFDLNQPSLPTPFCSFLVSFSVFTAISNVFHSINSSDNSLLPHSVLMVLFLLCDWSFQLCICLYESLSQPRYNPLWLTGLKAPTT